MNKEQWAQYSMARRNRHRLSSTQAALIKKIGSMPSTKDLHPTTAAALQRVSAEVGK